MTLPQTIRLLRKHGTDLDALVEGMGLRIQYPAWRVFGWLGYDRHETWCRVRSGRYCELRTNEIAFTVNADEI